MTSNDMTPTNPERNPIVVVRNGEVFANSRDVAAFFGKNHFDVIRAIKNLIEKAPELGSTNFASFKIKDLTGESISHFDMDRDGFSLLAMGFTGAKALKWKMAYIHAFNAMQAEIERQAKSGVGAIDLNDAGALRGLLLTYSEKAIELQAEIDELTPKAAALKRLEESDGSLCLTDAAKTLQRRPKDFIGAMRKSWIYSRQGGGYIAYQSKIQQGLLEHKTTTVTRPDGTEKTVTQVRVTPKGLVKLAEELGQH